MISGLDALHKLDGALRGMRGDFNLVDAELNHVAEALHGNRRQQAQLVSGLAEIRLDDLAAGRLRGEITSADERALEYLVQRQAAFKQLDSDIQASNDRLEAAENLRDTKVTEANAAAQAVIDCESKIQSQLEVDKAYQDLLEAARDTDGIAAEAELKAETASGDSKEKGQPFEADPLFMYLWKRRYGTPDYKGGILGRLLDGWVAGICDFEDYRVNYWTLQEIPKRLKTHAETARKQSDAAVEALAAYERELANQEGLPALQEKLDAGQDAVDRIDDDIEEQEETLGKLLQQRAQFAQAKDSFMSQSLQVLQEALGSKSLMQLNDAAHQTESGKDNRFVRELADLRDQQGDLQDELRDQRRLHEAKLGRLKELEGVRRRFKSRRFDDLRSGFSNEDIFGTILAQFLGGMIGGSDLWRTIERHQRHRDVGAWPDFGSGGLGGGFGRRTRMPRSPWHRPRGRGSMGGGFRLPRSGGWSSRGGGFGRSGGGRGGGGGGFRTGGGF